MTDYERLIERWIPLRETNLSSTIEKTFKQARAQYKSEFEEIFGAKAEVLGINFPVVPNLHTWFARRPCSAARVTTLASILPSSVSKEDFMNSVGFTEFSNILKKRELPIIYAVNPNRQKIVEILQKELGKSPEEITVIDPMAGGGSIPLESLRLGFNTIAVDYNPVAYLVLKATIEFPAKYADAGLFEEILKYAKILIKKAINELGKFYAPDSQGYIFARGIRCPYCGGLIPIQGIAPEITKKESLGGRFLKITYDKEAKTFHAETTDEKVHETLLEKRRFEIKCPYCEKWFKLRGNSKNTTTAFDKWFKEHAQLMEEVVEGFAPITPEIEEKLLHLHIPLIKETKDGFVAIWDDDKEKEKFVSAFRTLSENIDELYDYIPLDPIPKENKWASNVYNKGLTKWYMLFNPRQLLVISMLSKIVSEIAEEIASKNDEEFAAAVATYLAFAIDKLVDYNTIVTGWHRSRAVIEHTYKGPGITTRAEYCEAIPPLKNLPWALEPHIVESGKLTKTAGGILPVLKFLTDQFKGANLGDRIKIYNGDATKLSSFLETKVDLINVDPPYFEQVIYSDKSELFWVILRHSLKPVLPVLFNGLKHDKWSYTSPTVPREKEVVTYDKRDKKNRFRKLFKEFMSETVKILKDDGRLVLWFTHPTDLAWRTLGEGLYDSGYIVTKVYPLKTEMKTRFVRQVHGIAQEMSLIIVAKKGKRSELTDVYRKAIKESLLENPRFIEKVKEVAEESRKIAREASASPADTISLMFGSALSVATNFEISDVKFEPIYDAAITLIMDEFVKPLIKEIMKETGRYPISDEKLLKEIEENVERAMLRDSATRSYLTLWILSRVHLDTAEIREEPLQLTYDFAQTTAKLSGYDLDKLKETGLVEQVSGGSEGKAFLATAGALSAAKAKLYWSKAKTLQPIRALWLVQLALTKTGDAKVRSKLIRQDAIKEKIREDILKQDAALGLVLLQSALDEDIEEMVGKEKAIEANVNIAIETLLEIIRGE